MIKNSIVVDARMINYSGIGTYLKNILPHLVNNFNLFLLGDKNELKQFAFAKKSTIIPFVAKIYSIKEQFLFSKVIPPTDLLWCPHFNTPLFTVKAKIRICTIHDVNHIALKKNNFSIKQKYAEKLITNAVEKSDKIITVSQFSRNEILKYTQIKHDQIKVIHNGIEMDFTSKSSANIILDLPKKYILFVGNVKPHKNLKVLLKAYLKLPNELKSMYKIVVLGKKTGLITPDKNIHNFIKDNNLTDNVFFTGFLSDHSIPDIYKKAKIFVFPSNYEGFGLPLLEAMVTETPIICSDIKSSKEVAHNAVLYFKKDNSQNLKEKIIQLLNNSSLEAELVNKGKIRIKQFNWIDAAEAHIQLFNEVLSKL